MRKISVFLVALTIILLSSCAPSAEESEKIVDRLAALESFKTEMTVTAEYPSRVVSFRLEASVEGDGCVVRVLEPAELEGINVTIGAGECVVEYDGASFEAGDPSALDIAPVTAAAEVARLFRNASPREIGAEKRAGTDCVLLVYSSGTDETRVWVTLDTLTPTAAEFLRDGERRLTCEFDTFNTGGSENLADISGDIS